MYGSFASWMALRTAAFGSKNDGQASTPAAQHTQLQTNNLKHKATLHQDIMTST